MRIGVVISVDGFSPHLVQTLESVLSQTRPGDPVVVVDDGPTPAVELPPELRYVVPVVALAPEEGVELGGLQPEPDDPLAVPLRGSAWARNAGVLSFPDSVTHVAFCDGDDVWGPGQLAALLRAVEQAPDVAIFVGDAVLIGPDGRPAGRPWAGLGYGPHQGFLVRPTIFERNRLSISASLVRRDAYEHVGGFDPTMQHAEGLDLWLRMIDEGADFVSVLGATARLRRHPVGPDRDLVTIARARMEAHERHAGAVDPPVVRRARVADLRLLAAGQAQQGDYAGAHRTLLQAEAIIRPLPSERLRRALLAIPILRRRVRLTVPR